MYSRYIQDYLHQVSTYVGVEAQSVRLLDETVACFVGTLGRAIGARVEPAGDLLKVSLQLLLLDDGLSKLASTVGLEGAHYLVGLGFEQSGELLGRIESTSAESMSPLDDDYWYRMALAYLHYLAGGHRVQALSAKRHLEEISKQRREGVSGKEYQDSVEVLGQLYSVPEKPSIRQKIRNGFNWAQLIFGDDEPSDPQQRRISRLARQIRQRHDIVLRDLGQDNEATWLRQRGIDDPVATDFWVNYLKGLGQRGITSLTNEQRGPDPGFDAWLRLDTDLLVVLPTGSGKTLIGELRSALTLANGRQVLWIVPTRALVRQVQRDLKRAFGPLKVNVEELPTTEDFLPLFAQRTDQARYLAATTPEKLLALLRSNPDAVNGVGLVVVDEAQILLKESRGTTVEFVLQQIRHLVPSCNIVLMSAFEDTQVPLDKFLQRMGSIPRHLVSNIRPTRRVYGIISTDISTGSPHLCVSLYPPGIQDERGTTEHPLQMYLDRVKVKAQSSPIELAERFVREVTPSKIRTVLFVGRKDSTEAKADLFAAKISETVNLPKRDIARLHVELGRKSAIEESSQHGIAPHHAGLTPLEQHLAEKWVREGIVKTVVATPTLAQGINLPFDLSVVSFTTRFNERTKSHEPLSESEIMNMLGRAGRAGYVSDGVCLLAVQRDQRRTLNQQLDASRRFFFRAFPPSGERLGLSRLAEIAAKVAVDEPNWLTRLDGATFSEVQNLVTFVLEVGADVPDPQAALVERMKVFPSFQDLSQSDLDRTMARLGLLLSNVKSRCSNDPYLTIVLQKTGMPIEILEQFLANLRAASNVIESTPQEQILWADQVVRAALEKCSSRSWFQSLFGKFQLERLFYSISIWRAGGPIAEIETHLQRGDRNPRAERIAVGEFLNHRLPLIAQFWGALAVCEEVLNSRPPLRNPEVALYRAQTFVREGVESIEALEWLRAIGGIDRVLAHTLARTMEPRRKEPDLRSFIREQIGRWQYNTDVIPSELDDYRDAIEGVLFD